MDELRNFANQHAGIASIFNLGKSYEGREQQAIKVKIGWIAPIGEWIMNVLKYKRHNYFLKNRTNLSWVGWFQNVNIKIKYDLFQENGVPKFFSDKKIFQNFTIDSVLPWICICGSDVNHVLFFSTNIFRLWSSLAKHVDVGLTNKTWLSLKYHMQTFYGQNLIPVTKAAIEP